MNFNRASRSLTIYKLAIFERETLKKTANILAENKEGKMRKIVGIFIAIMLLLTANCLQAGSGDNLEKKIERKIIKQIISFVDERPIEIVWADKLKIIRKESQPYWTGRIIHFRAGYLPAEIKLKKGKKIRKADIMFMAGYGEEDGKIVSEACEILNIAYQDSPNYESEKKKFMGLVKATKPFER
ncbi:MAG: hypothetical protein NT136_00735 [Candidatus Moranbacteria bacterium]|nr:hypothetical protein [Candidatus Moranbacteria bacterium]